MVAAYTLEAFVDKRWVDITVRGGTVGVGTIDLRTEPVRATKLRWTCRAASMSNVSLSAVDLYLATPPPNP